jgi:uncharacterized glyoxalase superfamily protein PhnB
MNPTIARVSPILGVKRVRQAAEYYRDVLGFSLDPLDGVFQPSPNEPDGVYGIVKKGDVWIHFQIRRDDISIRERHAIERDVYLYVDDIAATFAELTARGAKVICPPSTTPYGICEFTIEDLNGFRLTYGEPV